jgi:hypothetical protein
MEERTGEEGRRDRRERRRREGELIKRWTEIKQAEQSAKEWKEEVHSERSNSASETFRHFITSRDSINPRTFSKKKHSCLFGEQGFDKKYS